MPEPLHPAVVHFPIVLAFLSPLVLATVLVAIRSGRLPERAWAFALVLPLAAVAAGWLAMETGEEEEERVERVVREELIEEHEEAAERFMMLAAATAALAAAGLLRGAPGSAARVLAVVVSVAATAAVGAAGHQGGELVYQHGAAAAYAQDGAAGVDLTRLGHEEEEDDHD